MIIKTECFKGAVIIPEELVIWGPKTINQTIVKILRLTKVIQRYLLKPGVIERIITCILSE